jgi:hypothetical protein
MISDGQHRRFLSFASLRLKMPIVKVRLDEYEYSGLVRICESELRIPSNQLRYILRRELGHRGLIIQKNFWDCFDRHGNSTFNDSFKDSSELMTVEPT